MSGGDTLHRKVNMYNSFLFPRTNSNNSNLIIISQLIGIFLIFSGIWLKVVAPFQHITHVGAIGLRLAILAELSTEDTINPLMYVSMMRFAIWKAELNISINHYILKTHRNINIHHWMCAKSTIASKMGCVYLVHHNSLSISNEYYCLILSQMHQCIVINT